MLLHSIDDQNRSLLPIGPTGLWWNFPLRSACSTLCKSSGTQEPNSLSLLLRLPWRSLSCLWTASTLWFASVRSVLWSKNKMAQLILAKYVLRGKNNITWIPEKLQCLALLHIFSLIPLCCYPTLPQLVCSFFWSGNSLLQLSSMMVCSW